MQFLTKTKTVRKVSTTVGKHDRVSTDLSLTKLLRQGEFRETFQISQKKFEELSLDTNSICFGKNNNEIFLIVVKEDSELATSLGAKREGTKEKARSFGSVELLTQLKADGIIANEVPNLFKAEFKLEVRDVNEVKSQVGDYADDIQATYALVFEKSGMVEPRVKKVVGMGDAVAPTFIANEDDDDVQEVQEDEEDELDID
jgi:hypothetical protein